MTDLDKLIEERSGKHGVFYDRACCHVAFLGVLDDFVTGGLEPDQASALDMIMHKISRIIVGNPDHADHWRDIAGYATLVADRLETGLKR